MICMYVCLYAFVRSASSAAFIALALIGSMCRVCFLRASRCVGVNRAGCVLFDMDVVVARERKKGFGREVGIGGGYVLGRMWWL